MMRMESTEKGSETVEEGLDALTQMRGDLDALTGIVGELKQALSAKDATISEVLKSNGVLMAKLAERAEPPAPAEPEIDLGEELLERMGLKKK